MMDTLEQIHELYMVGICIDIINGTLLTKLDNNELEIVMLEMYDDMSSYEAMGVTIGKA
tara:strand:+ start:1979 stop:2155 length:177 start_codon:yes stop_codon:yes gene_type:complete